MKFRVLTSNKRRLERVLDASLLLLIMGIFLRHIKASEDCFLFGILGLGWACFSWVLQKEWIPDKLWAHIVAVILLFILLFVSVAVIP